MAAKERDRSALRSLTPKVLRPLRKASGRPAASIAEAMGLTPRAYQDFESGRTALRVERVLQFAEILDVDAFAILAALFLGKPRIALAFAGSKFLLIQATVVGEFDETTQDAMAAVDPLTMLEAHTQFYRQLTAHGLQQLEASGRRPRGAPVVNDASGPRR